MPPSFDYEERLGNKYHPEYDDFWVAYAGVRWGDLKAHSKIIERYSLDGSPEVKYELSEAVESFIVLDNPDRIIGINPDQNEDNFLVYNL